MNPFHLGVVQIAGSAISLSTIASGKPTRVRTLSIDNTGTGTMYVGKSTMNITTLVDVVLRIPAGQSRSVGGVNLADDINWDVYTVHGDTPGDLMLITGQTIS